MQGLKPPASVGASSSKSPTRLPQPPSIAPPHSQDELSKRRSLLPGPGTNIPESFATRTRPTNLQRSNSVQTSGIPSHTKAPSLAKAIGADSRIKRSEQVVDSQAPQMATKTSGIGVLSRSHGRTTSSQSGLNRSQSVKHPSTSDATSETRSIRSHSRSLSNVSTKGQTGPISMARQVPDITSSRRTAYEVADLRVPNISRASTITASTGADIRQRGITSSNNLKHPSTVKSSQSRSLGPPTLPTVGQNPSVEFPGTRGASVNLRQQAKPTFTTLQQHFSPKKASKPPISSLGQPITTDDANGLPLSTEMVRLQTELLQLHVLYCQSLDHIPRFHNKAAERLHTKYNNISKEYRSMQDARCRIDEQLSMMALQKWSSEDASLGLAGNVQMLSSLVQELTVLMQDGGRFYEVERTFESWVILVEDEDQVEGNRSDASFFTNSTDRLGASWWTESSALARRLTALSPDVNMMADPDESSESSSCGRLVRACKKMHSTMLDALSVMMRIVREAEVREQQWIEEKLAAITSI